MNRITQAALFAERAHRGQKRKYSGRPYIEHPGRVAMQATLLGLGEDVVIAAWLHDTLEDTLTDRPTLEHLFGEEVAFTVELLTNRYTKKNHPTWNREDRKKAEAERLYHCPWKVKVIKCLDRADNLMDLRYTDDPTFYKDYLAESEYLAGYIAQGPAGEVLREQLKRNREIAELVLDISPKGDMMKVSKE